MHELSTDAHAFAPPPSPAPTSRGAVVIASMIAGGLLMGAVIGWWVGRVVKRTGAQLPVGVDSFAWLPVAWFVAVAVHEAGHLVMGVRTGMTPVLYVVGPLRVSRDGGRMRAGFNTNLATWGGLAASVPRGVERFAERMSLVVAGGPLASLLLALACAALVAVLGAGAHPLVPMTGMLSAAIGVATLLPSNLGGFSSDGAQLLAYRRGEARVELRGQLLVLAAAGMAGTRPRELDRALIERGLALDGTPLERLSLRFTAATAAVDRGEDAAGHFAAVARHWYDYPDGFRQSLALWLAWYLAAVRREGAQARAWLALGRGGIVDGALRELAEAAVAAHEGDTAARDAAIARAARRGPGMDPGGDKLVRDLLRALPAAGETTASQGT